MAGGRSRRAFLSGGLAAAAAAAAPSLSWADAGGPRYLAAARRADGAFALCGLSHTGDIVFEIDLPARGHAAAAHPSLPLAVAFARRPGRYALVIDCARARLLARLEAPAGRHFYGHGAFDRDGDRLFTTENAYEPGVGRVGVWDATGGFARMGEWASGGVGPHDALFDPASNQLVVANGGVQTHPDSGRAKLNLPTMRSNLARLDARDGAVATVSEPPPELRLNSMRHLARRADGLVGVALQWQGSPLEAPPLLALHLPGARDLAWLAAAPRDQRRLQGYAGGVAFSEDGRRVAITSPRGGAAHLFDPETGALADRLHRPDICGVAPAAGGFAFSDGGGGLSLPTAARSHAVAWDNHLVAI